MSSYGVLHRQLRQQVGHLRSGDLDRVGQRHGRSQLVERFAGQVGAEKRNVDPSRHFVRVVDHQAQCLQLGTRHLEGASAWAASEAAVRQLLWLLWPGSGANRAAARG